MKVYPKTIFGGPNTGGIMITVFLGEAEVEPYQSCNNQFRDALNDVRRRYKVAYNNSNFSLRTAFNEAAEKFATRYSSKRLLHYAIHSNFLIRVFAKRLSENKTLDADIYYCSTTLDNPEEKESYLFWKDEQYKNIFDKQKEVNKTDYTKTDQLIYY